MADGNLIVHHEARPVGPTFDQIKEMARYFANSKMFGVSSPEQAFSLLMIAQSEGLHPARAMQEYHVIKNKPTLKAEAMLGRFQVAGGRVKWVKHEDDEVTAEFTHESSGTTTITWDMARAKTAGILGNDTWKKYPRQMLRARVISEGVRLSYPACIVGFYAVEEAQDFDDRKPEPVRAQKLPDDVQDAEVVDVGHVVPRGDVAPLDAGERSNREIKVGYNNLLNGMGQCSTVEALDEWAQAWADDIEGLPEDHKASLRGEYRRRRDSLKAVSA